MVNVNVLYDSLTGRILSASPHVIVAPPGYSLLVANVADASVLVGQKVQLTPTPSVYPKDVLRYDSDAVLGVATVDTAVWTKRDGVTDALEGTVGDNDPFLISARQPDYSFRAPNRRAFFDVPQGVLLSGAGQVKIATGLAPGTEIVVVYSDTLRSIFETLTYQ